MVTANAGVASATGEALGVLNIFTLTPDALAGVAQVEDPTTIGTLQSPTNTAATATVPVPKLILKPTPANVNGRASVGLPSLHSGAAPTTSRWIILDPTTGETYEFDLNPSDERWNPYIKNIAYRNTLPGKSIIYEIQSDASEISWEGIILTQSQYMTLEHWYANENELLLTDDLGRTFEICLTEFTPKRIRKASTPWYHTYEMKALII